MIKLNPFTPQQPATAPAAATFAKGAASIAQDVAKPALTVTNTASAPVGADEVTEAVEADCARRDDAIGRLIASIFQYPAPPMPEFR